MLCSRFRLKHVLLSKVARIISSGLCELVRAYFLDMTPVTPPP